MNTPVVHACPTDVTPCCGRTLSELPPTDRVSGDERTVTCGAAGDVTEWVKRLVGAWDCCATCAGGVVAERDRRVMADMLDRLAAAEATIARYEHGLSWDTTCENCANLLDRCYAETVRAETAEAVLARVVVSCDWLAGERDRIREAYRAHNAGRAEGRPQRRPDLDTWACAYEVAERNFRAALDGEGAS